MYLRARAGWEALSVVETRRVALLGSIVNAGLAGWDLELHASGLRAQRAGRVACSKTATCPGTATRQDGASRKEEAWGSPMTNTLQLVFREFLL